MTAESIENGLEQQDADPAAALNAEVRRLKFLLGLTEHLQASGDLREIGRFALTYLVKAMGAAFGDVKVIDGWGSDRRAQPLINKITAQFIATHGEPAIAEMQSVLDAGIAYGQGVLWQVVESGEPLFIENYSEQSQAVAQFRHPAIGQLGIFPIPATDGTIIGVLTLESRSVTKLQQAPQQDMLLAACRILGAAIERAQAQAHLQAINEDLERASRLKSEFLASMSHELRTPLNSILGFSDLMLRQTKEPLSERQISHLRVIEKSGQHLLQLINDILDLSKIEAGKADLDLQLVSMQDLCRQCLKMIQPRADKKRLTLYLELDYRLDQVWLDERRVRQMTINLLSNAVKFTPEAGQIKLSGRLAYGNQLLQDFRPDRSPINPSTPYLCLEVADSGIGIAESKWPLLFRPFQQVDSSLSRRHEGTGLGLALTKRLAELHGGTVSVASIEGEGSTFRIWLPLTEQREELAAASASLQLVPHGTLSDPAESLGTVPRVLVVEDQIYNQVLISEFLELEGYAVELISDGRTMLEAIHSPFVTSAALPSLILMDVQLPEIDGFELMRQLKAHPVWRQVPVIAVTAMAMAGDRDRCLQAGADAYLSKPLDFTIALNQIRSLMPDR
jgi:two-component system, sensor histidine kinase